MNNISLKDIIEYIGFCPILIGFLLMGVLINIGVYCFYPKDIKHSYN